MDSTKKIAKKLAGSVEGTASWATNVANECGLVLNSVLKVAEGAGLDAMVQGVVKRYVAAGEDPLELLYMDQDCCAKAGDPKPLMICHLFRPWRTIIRLDIWHLMRRFSSGTTTDNHPLYVSSNGQRRMLPSCVLPNAQSWC